MHAPSTSGYASGPRTARLFVWVLAVLWAIAWWSWGIQAAPLVGSGGVWPLGTAMCPPTSGATAQVPPPEACISATPFGAWLLPYLTAPAGDAVIWLSIGLGLLAATAAICNLWPRSMLAASAVLFAGFVQGTPAFFPSIGDKLLLEASLVAVLLPRNRPSPMLHVLGRLMVVKLYFSMGAAQWLASDNGWQRGSALRELLQDTPLPTRTGWYMAHLPGPWVSAGTKLTLLLQLCVPWLAFGPSVARLLAAAILTALQIVVANLVNDGLFSFVAVAMHLLLLNDQDVAAIERDIARIAQPMAALFARLTLPRPQPAAALPNNVYVLPRMGRALHGQGNNVRSALLAGYLTAAVLAMAATLHFGSDAWQRRALGHFGYTYAHVGRQLSGRVEPIFEVQAAGAWHAVELWHQPGDPWRAPQLVLPHQPRLDAQLSAAGRSYDDVRAQGVVFGLLHRLCAPAGNLQRLLRTPLPAHVTAVRVRYDAYSFADWQQHQQTGVWWTRAQVADGPSILCAAPAAAPTGPAEAPAAASREASPQPASEARPAGDTGAAAGPGQDR